MAEYLPTTIKWRRRFVGAIFDDWIRQNGLFLTHDFNVRMQTMARSTGCTVLEITCVFEEVVQRLLKDALPQMSVRQRFSDFLTEERKLEVKFRLLKTWVKSKGMPHPSEVANSAKYISLDAGWELKPERLTDFYFELLRDVPARERDLSEEDAIPDSTSSQVS